MSVVILATNDATISTDAETGLPSEPVPIRAVDLAAHVHHLLAGRGLNPVTSREVLSAAEHGAALMLAAYGALPVERTHGAAVPDDSWPMR